MYSLEEREKAVKLYIQYGLKAAKVIRELGYPNRHVIVRWYQEYRYYSQPTCARAPTVNF